MKKISIDEYTNTISEITDNDYSVLGERFVKTEKKSRRELLVKHNSCGYEYYVQPAHFIKCGYRCVRCSKSRAFCDIDIFKKRVYDLTGDEYTVLGEYKNMYTKIRIRHNKCNTEYDVAPKHFISGTRCTKCLYNTLRLKNFIDILKENDVNDIELVGEYKSYHEKVTLKHLKCGTVFTTIACDVIESAKRFNRSNCPSCRDISYGERLLYNILNEKSINFTQQYSFKDCKNKRPLRFDFAIFKDGELKGLIEYDGKQHFDMNSQYADNGRFDEIKLRDDIKDKYCSEKNIPLLRIPYLDRKDKIVLDINTFLDKIMFNDYPIGGEIPQQE